MSPAADTPTRTVDGVLIGPSGMTLYTFARDVADSGKSACNDACATNWPPLAAPEAGKPMGGYSVLTRADGKKQWAYKGWPLYYWSKDAKAGDPHRRRPGERRLESGAPPEPDGAVAPAFHAQAAIALRWRPFLFTRARRASPATG